MMSHVAAEISRYPAGYTQFLLGAGLLLEPTRELVIVGTSDAVDTDAMLGIVQGSFMPDTRLLLRSSEDSTAIDKLAPFLVGMEMQNGRATAYLCENFSCQKPVNDLDLLKKSLLKEEK